MVTPVFSKSGKNGNESIAFKSSNVARAPMKSVQVQVTHQSVHIPTQVNQFTSQHKSISSHPSADELTMINENKQ